MKTKKLLKKAAYQRPRIISIEKAQHIKMGCPKHDEKSCGVGYRK